MLHEEEFFDAIDATLDKWDKEEEKVCAATYNHIFLLLTEIVIQIVNDNVYGVVVMVHPVHLMNIAQALGGRRPLDQASQPEPQIRLNWQL